MNFSNQLQLNTQINGMGLYNPSSPTAVEFNGNLYLFYVGSGKDGIWYSVWNGQNWSGLTQLYTNNNVQISYGTSPYAIVYNGVLYLFYCGTYGNNSSAVCYLTFDGTWSSAYVIPPAYFLPNTSPSATILNDVLYVFWNGVANDGIWYSTYSESGDNWTGQVSVRQLVPGMNVATGTSPSAVTYNNQIYLFFNGSGNNGTFYAIYNNGSWSGVFPMSSLIGGMAFGANTSPASCITQNGDALALFWASPQNQIWYTTLDLTGWLTPQQLMTCPNAPDGVGILSSTSPSVTIYQSIPLVFWNGSANDGIWEASLMVFELSAQNFASIVLAMYQGYNFAITCTDKATITALQSTFTNSFLNGDTTLNQNITMVQPLPNNNPVLPNNIFANLNGGQLTYLLTLVIGLVGYAIYIYNRINIHINVDLINQVYTMEFITNNNNQPLPNNNIPQIPDNNNEL